ncbi:hypothetical protein BdWA1_002462 [Babesia duncani]|uniref:Uncharacterized protein n=1 Tax=Babesia duncani TaxID=323732 RepID=A0AAD9UNG6_9APIC|nr:hypothetical protein BdWA1_002462 [Babesia duncani]
MLLKTLCNVLAFRSAFLGINNRNSHTANYNNGLHHILNRNCSPFIVHATSDENSDGVDPGSQEFNEDKELNDLIVKQYEEFVASNSTDSSVAKKWFNDDELMDETDHRFAAEYCATKVPDMDTIYKNLDPYGIRKHLPHNLSLADMNLGSVYTVGPSLCQKIEKNVEEQDPIPVDPKLAKDLKDDPPLDTGDEEGETHEFDFGEEFDEDPEDPNVVLKDDLHRYFIKLPVTQWTGDEKEALDECLIRLDRSKRYYREQEPQPYVSDIQSVFSYDACSDVGITDTVHKIESSHTKINPADLLIEEYPHNDLLNDIDAYEKQKYPEVVNLMVERDIDKAIFTFNEYKPNYSGNDIVDLSVYVAIPKLCIDDEEEEGSMLMDEPIILKRNLISKQGKTVKRIPISKNDKVGVIVLPNEAGFKDQNIRYLSDEICAIAKSMVFVPNINENDMMFRLTLNRLIKFIQLVYKIDRLVFVALGIQGQRLLPYVHEAMQNSINDCNYKAPSHTNTLSEIDDLDILDTRRYDDLQSRQSVSMLDDIIEGIQKQQATKSLMAAQKSRDVNRVKPISRLLHAIVFLDSVNLNLKMLAELGIPSLILPSNRSKILEDCLNFDDAKFVEKRKLMQKELDDSLLNVFDYIKGEMPIQLKNLCKENKLLFNFVTGEENVKQQIEQYHISTKHAGIDILINRYPDLTGHYYMKKPNSTTEELEVHFGFYNTMYRLLGMQSLIVLDGFLAGHIDI